MSEIENSLNWLEKNIDDLFIRNKYLNEWRNIKSRGVSAIIDCAAPAPKAMKAMK